MPIVVPVSTSWLTKHVGKEQPSLRLDKKKIGRKNNHNKKTKRRQKLHWMVQTTLYTEICFSTNITQPSRWADCIDHLPYIITIKLPSLIKKNAETNIDISRF